MSHCGKFLGSNYFKHLRVNLPCSSCPTLYMSHKCPLFCLLAWIGFGFKVGGTEDSLSDRSFTASSMLTSFTAVFSSMLYFFFLFRVLCTADGIAANCKHFSHSCHMWCFQDHICYLPILCSHLHLL